MEGGGVEEVVADGEVGAGTTVDGGERGLVDRVGGCCCTDLF